MNSNSTNRGNVNSGVTSTQSSSGSNGDSRSASEDGITDSNSSNDEER